MFITKDTVTACVIQPWIQAARLYGSPIQVHLTSLHTYFEFFEDIYAIDTLVNLCSGYCNA